MASNLLTIIADVADWAPDEATAAELEALAQRLFAGRCAELRVEDFGEVAFIDQGGLFEDITCPACGSGIGIPWWQDRMDESFEAAFTDLGVTVPCCGAATSLNKLEYRLPAGFARFAISVRDLDHPWAGEEEVAALSRVAGQPLRQVLARY